ncbi:MAG: hypothetical protein K0S11_1822 [Gammaproteobacteria bacterium]|jgi:hypothetical protein|nr:hypothetical protein [Gammaproteobacteria bacterium]
MADDNKEQNSTFFDQSFWDELKKLEEGDEWSVIADIGKALTRPVTSIELAHVLRHYAYLEIGDASIYELKSVDPEGVKFTKSKSGWLIHDHGSVLRASPGRMLYRSHNAFAGESDDESGGGVGYGTIVQQYVDTTRDMLTIAQARWPGARVLSGYRPMQFAAYLIAQASHYILEGIELTDEETRTYQYVKQRVQAILSEAPEPDRMPR